MDGSGFVIHFSGRTAVRPYGLTAIRRNTNQCPAPGLEDNLYTYKISSDVFVKQGLSSWLIFVGGVGENELFPHVPPFEGGT